MIAAAGQPSRFPWPELLRFGLGRLRLSPRDFWALSLRELACIVSPEAPSLLPLGRGELEALMAKFPDIRGGAA